MNNTSGKTGYQLRSVNCSYLFYPLSRAYILIGHDCTGHMVVVNVGNILTFISLQRVITNLLLEEASITTNNYVSTHGSHWLYINKKMI